MTEPFNFPALAHLPAPASRNLAVRLSPVGERAVRQGHPWVFASAVQKISHPGNPGDLAVIFDSSRDFLAVGLYDPTSAIRIRVLQAGKPARIDLDFFLNRIAAAARLRLPLSTALDLKRTDGYRLIHGENDGLPGLVVDRYAGTLVLKLYSPAWLPHLPAVCRALLQVRPADNLILRLSRSLQDLPDHLHGLHDGQVLFGVAPAGPVLFQENGLFFEAEPLYGQKTGFFLDQRENRARVETLSHGKSVLNVFAYTAGFSVYAARGGAVEVTSVDLSVPACAAAERNFAHNRHFPAVAACRHTAIAEDAFELLARFAAQARSFDLVILDPPMFAQNQSQTAAALNAYRRLTRLGLSVLAPGGILVQASCSSRVAASDFFDAVHQAARAVGRPLQEIERTDHPLDHPIGFKEGAYLKCLFAHAS